MFKRILLTVLAVFIFCTCAYSAVVYHRQGLTGGGLTDLDQKDGTSLADGDSAFVNESDIFYTYQMDVSSGVAESSPDVISPDTNAGTKRWILQNVYSLTVSVIPPTGVELTGGIAGFNLF